MNLNVQIVQIFTIIITANILILVKNIGLIIMKQKKKYQMLFMILKKVVIGTLKQFQMMEYQIYFQK